MGTVNEMLQDICIPRMVRARQRFDESCIEDVAGALREELSREAIAALIRPGMRIAITAGSRGVDNIALVIREIASFLKEKGAAPFVIPAMGSHGGATVPGQMEVLASFGIVEAYIGCPIHASMETVCIGALDDGRPIHIDKYAAEADGIIPVGRVKPHTAFRARYESGVMKMMAIGLGKQQGAEVCHKAGILHLAENVEQFAFGVLRHADILFGVGLVENAFDKTAVIRAMTREEIPEVEPVLLDMAKAKMARIMFDQVDVLVVDEIGKNISGEGMDPNIAGRWIVPNIKSGIDATRVAILDVTDESHGNTTGLSMADVCSKRAVEKMDPETTYPNSLTSTVTILSGIPMYFDNHRYTIQAAIKMLPGKTPEEITMIRIKNTLELGEIELSETLLPQAQEMSDLEILGEPRALVFNENGDLF